VDDKLLHLHTDPIARNEEAIRDGLARQLLEAAPDATVIANNDGVIIFANQQIERLFGLSPGELIGQPIETLIPERFRQTHIAHRQSYSRRPTIRMMSERPDLFGRRSDGSEFPVEIMLSPLMFGGELLVSAAIRDVTQRKAYEQTLRDNEQRFRIAIQNSPLVIFNQDCELRYTWTCNAPKDWSAERIMGKTDADLLPPEAAAKLMASKRLVLETGERLRQIVEVPRDGQATFWDLMIEPMRDVRSAIVGIACAMLDVTERIRREQEIQLQTRSLQELMKVNTEALSAMDRQLLAAEHMAALGTAAAGLTHDLSNLLLPIQIRVDVLEGSEAKSWRLNKRGWSIWPAFVRARSTCNNSARTCDC